ncbi:TRAP transporter large permease [Oceanobacillus alkalisoli]|uniref:TRAP transporter large permease n=1 Tax=Oceanobacillus alkalisoli TaxID=2925113 RepID=UPI001EE4517A|nr:TRAP transporter large permease subunit [Oceanobacillus alkalisoli]MCG5102589.1 TRAP transporter large permease subunit [Oceanobacillus alkalisoli]
MMEFLQDNAVIVLFITFALLLVMRVPIGISLGISSIVGLVLIDFNIRTIPHNMFSAVDSVILMAIPGFIFAGLIMAKGGISYHLIEALKSWVGHIKGGLAVVTILACMIFAAISGSSPATAAAVGSIMIPAMIDAGYSKKYAMGLIAAGGTLGILIPPSIALIIYGSITEQSISDLFIAGVIPGILLGLMLIIFAIIYARKHNLGGLEKATWDTRRKMSIKAIWGFFLPVIIIGGIYMGAVTPTEASIVAVFYSIIISVFIYKEMNMEKFIEIVKESINTTAMIFLIIASALIFSTFLTIEQVPQFFSEWIADNSANKWIFIIGVNVLFFILGMFLEAVAIILITLPILLPALLFFDINLIHFAIIMTINMELAMITPPVGLNLFVVSGIAKERLGTVVRGVIPFFIIMVICLILVIFIPEISLLLVDK